MTVLDFHGRKLTADEQAQRDRLLPALQVWTDYLDDVPAARTFARAVELSGPVIAQHRPTPIRPGRPATLYSPLVVFPQWALQWAQRKGRLGAAGTGSLLTFGQLVSALDFMGASRAITFSAVGEPTRRRREGFFHLQREVVARLRSATYVPVLTRRPGRPLSRDRVAGGHTARALRRADGDYTLTIVRDWVRVNPTTALYSVAATRGYPLATRPPGRPRTSVMSGAQVSTDSVVGCVEALAGHAAEHADRLGIRVPGAGELASALASHAADGATVTPVQRFSTPDGGQRKHARGWWRFALAPLGLPPVEPGELLAEVQHWWTTQGRGWSPEPVVVGRTIGDVVLPDDIEPEWLEDEEYRDILGIKSEDYARWKEGL